MAQRTINSARNPKWADADQTMIDLEVDFDELDETYVPFTAKADDGEPHGVVLWNNAINGDYGPIGAFTLPDDITGSRALNMLREARDELLAQTDYIEMPTKWSSLTADQQAAWTTYRNALRDMPSDNPNVYYSFDNDLNPIEHNVTWPTKPE